MNELALHTGDWNGAENITSFKLFLVWNALFSIHGSSRISFNIICERSDRELAYTNIHYVKGHRHYYPMGE